MDTLVRQSAIDGQECPSYVFRFCSETCERVLAYLNYIVRRGGGPLNKSGRCPWEGISRRPPGSAVQGVFGRVGGVATYPPLYSR